MEAKWMTILGTFPNDNCQTSWCTHNAAEAGAGHDSHMRERSTMSVGTGFPSERELQDEFGYHVRGLHHVSASKAGGQSGHQTSLN